MSLRPPCPAPGRDIQPARGDMTGEQAKAEAGRCLSMHSCQGCEICVLICPDLAVTKDPETGRPVIDLAFCKGCGLCAHFCPKGALSMIPDRG